MGAHIHTQRRIVLELTAYMLLLFICRKRYSSFEQQNELAATSQVEHTSEQNPPKKKQMVRRNNNNSNRARTNETNNENLKLVYARENHTLRVAKLRKQQQ